jgi:hypothetical protein
LPASAGCWWLLGRYWLTGRFFVIQISRKDARVAKPSILGGFAPWREDPLFLAVLTVPYSCQFVLFVVSILIRGSILIPLAQQ